MCEIPICVNHVGDHSTTTCVDRRAVVTIPILFLKTTRPRSRRQYVQYAQMKIVVHRPPIVVVLAHGPLTTVHSPQLSAHNPQHPSHRPQAASVCPQLSAHTTEHTVHITQLPTAHNTHHTDRITLPAASSSTTSTTRSPQAASHCPQPTALITQPAARSAQAATHNPQHTAHGAAQNSPQP